MKNVDKYKRSYFLPPERFQDWSRKDHIEKAPVWCSVDLRDGNQALVEPMSLGEKVEYFKLLTAIGFKEIEVGFPAASETEYRFVRILIEQHLIPQDVTIQVLTQARPHIIKRTFEAVEGAPGAIIHLYNSTSVAQRQQVFHKSRAEVQALAVEGARLLKELAQGTEGKFRFEYSPESFPGTEVDYALEVCNAVLDVWQPCEDRPVIINIPTTVENAMPHVFAGQIEYVSKKLKYREQVLLSLHPHNDRGCGVSDAELGLLAGADRIEGTLFGNGERTGNADLVTLAMNLYSQGVDPGLDFSDMPAICDTYERLTGMHVHERQPYAGALVFAAFSGSHQDAIAKGMQWREERQETVWNVPYLPIDPRDVGREYETSVIRINSQSGKGGVGYILHQKYGLNMPAKMKEEMGYLAKSISDLAHKELTPGWIYEIFTKAYVEHTPFFTVDEWHYQQVDGGLETQVTVRCGDKQSVVCGFGNGRLDSVSNALKEFFREDYTLAVYEEHALDAGSSSKAAAYVGIVKGNQMYWGCGIDPDIIKASVQALVVAINRMQESM